MNKKTKIFIAEIVLISIICSYNNIFLLAFLWVILHELSHMIVASLIGCKFNNIQLHIFGAKAELLDLEEFTDKKKLLIYIAGPAFNGIMAIILFIIGLNIKSFIINESINLNIGLVFFNLLPAYPLDGSRIYEILLSKRMLYKKAQKIMSIVSYCMAAFCFATAVVGLIFLHKFNISSVIAGIIIIYITKCESRDTMYIIMGNIVKKRKSLIKNNYIDNKTLSVYYKNGLVNVLGLVDRNKFNTFYVLDEEMKLLYILNEDELIEALKIHGNITLQEYIKERHGSL
ncbi:site-2 protease family protein [Clostridium gasigenes]|uniref:Peptidase M50 n=1 Tax=Clostridium gasigenes TaxID=94869 RepID=A0A1H0S0H0_9CLOT|nr:site-2 protease family protein [Clostridium gasigenes]MBB6714277.1 peptidase M50 [Clostridium gasigenes]MBU3088611.1 peptidase M50 [Clostridium gasigenes]MBU3132867.1 peptidase M50 [Clostridium gasigenes]SDP35127.1 stage IV sporulation protein FB [Clostridium gasigenes]